MNFNNINFDGKIWLKNNEGKSISKGKIKLLKLIREKGSLSKASKELNMSYKAAWDKVKQMNSFFDSPLVEKKVGGKGGGSTILTTKGHEIINFYDECIEKFEKFLKNLIEKE